MTARAHVETDFLRDGVSIFLSPREGQAIDWGIPTVKTYDRDTTVPDIAPLGLDNDSARALYEALADHYGHAGHDTRALRRDYDAERARVDKLIDAAIRAQGTRTP